MKRRRFKAVLPIFLSGTLLFGSALPAYADFWDDLGRAALAVATGGASEVVRQLIDTVRRLIDLVNSVSGNLTRNANEVARAAADGVRGSVDEARRAMDQARHDLDEALRKAQREVQAEKNRMQTIGQVARTVPPPAPRGAPSQGARACLHRRPRVFRGEHRGVPPSLWAEARRLLRAR